MRPRGEATITSSQVGAMLARDEFPGSELALLTLQHRVLREAIEADQDYAERILAGKVRKSDEGEQEYGERILHGVSGMVTEVVMVEAKMIELGWERPTREETT